MDALWYVVAFCLGVAAGAVMLSLLNRPRFAAYDAEQAAAAATIAQLAARLATPPTPVRAAPPERPVVVLSRADHIARLAGFVADAKALADGVPSDTAAKVQLTEWTQRVQRWTADVRGYLSEHCSMRAADTFIGSSESSTRESVPGVHVDVQHQLLAMQRRSKNLGVIMNAPDGYLPV